MQTPFSLPPPSSPPLFRIEIDAKQIVVVLPASTTGRDLDLFAQGMCISCHPPSQYLFSSMHSILCVPRRETERLRCFECFSFAKSASRSAADLLNEGRPRSPKLKVGPRFLAKSWTSMFFVTCTTHSEFISFFSNSCQLVPE